MFHWFENRTLERNKMERFETHLLLGFSFTNKYTQKSHPGKDNTLPKYFISFQDILLEKEVRLLSELGRGCPPCISPVFLHVPPLYTSKRHHTSTTRTRWLYPYLGRSTNSLDSSKPRPRASLHSTTFTVLWDSLRSLRIKWFLFLLLLIRFIIKFL